MLVESIPDNDCVKNLSNRFNCVPWKRASIDTAGCRVAVKKVMTVSLVCQRPVDEAVVPSVSNRGKL
jgi:hypothetical protein